MGRLHDVYKNSPLRRRLSRWLKDNLISALTAGALRVVGLVPLRIAIPLADLVGGAIFFLLPAQRRLALEHLDIAFGDSLSADEKRRIVRAALCNVARSFCELARIDEIRSRPDKYIELYGREYLEGPLREGRSVIAVTGHIGNWELLASYISWSGLHVAAVAREIYEGRINALLVDYRSRQGVETILRESANAARQILRALKSRTILAMLIDQDTQVQSVAVPFFGKDARTPAAAATLSLRREVPVVAVFIERRPRGGHRITVQPPFSFTPTGDRLLDTKRMTAQFNHAIEEQIRRCPQEWVWWHRRWRRRPVAGLDLDADKGAPIEG